jgi:hypothetical protein
MVQRIRVKDSSGRSELAVTQRAAIRSDVVEPAIEHDRCRGRCHVKIPRRWRLRESSPRAQRGQRQDRGTVHADIHVGARRTVRRCVAQRKWTVELKADGDREAARLRLIQGCGEMFLIRSVVTMLP